MGSSSDCWYASVIYRVVNFSSTWISLDLSLHGNTEPFGGKEWNWISVTLYGILNPTNGSMLPPDFAWGKVVMFHCFASNIMELVLGFLC